MLDLRPAPSMLVGIRALAFLAVAIAGGPAVATAQCARLDPATFIQNTQRCNPSSGEPSWEASGLVYHEVRRQLLVVGDEGDLVAMDGTSGAILQTWCLPADPDLEGICVADPCTSLVYLLDESAFAVYEFDLATSAIRRSFPLPIAGYEAITFVPDPTHPHGGLFYLGVQTSGRILVYELPIRHPTATNVILRNTIDVVPPAWISDVDLRDLDFHRDSGVLYALSRTANVVLALDRQGRFQRCWTLERIAAQEGIAVHGCTLYTAIDTGSWFLEVHRGFPSPEQCPTLESSVTSLSAASGGAARLTFAPGVAFANQVYLLVGSASGTSPGFAFDGFQVPLNIDAYTVGLLQSPNPSGAFSIGNLGVLDASGVAATTLTIPPLLPALVGLTLHHAGLCFSPNGRTAEVSNSVPLCIRA